MPYAPTDFEVDEAEAVQRVLASLQAQRRALTATTGMRAVPAHDHDASPLPVEPVWPPLLEALAAHAARRQSRQATTTSETLDALVRQLQAESTELEALVEQRLAALASMLERHHRAASSALYSAAPAAAVPTRHSLGRG